MKVLLGHNFYRSSAPSGEDIAYSNEKRMLCESSADVLSYEKHNDDLIGLSPWQKIQLGLSNSWSYKSYDEVKKKIRSEKPDIAHFHNTFPQITPSVYAACKEEGVPVVQTLHNFRLLCANALLMKEGMPCELCVGGSLRYAIQHKCYRDSYAASASQVLCIKRNRLNGNYSENVSCYIALTDFAKNKFIQAGFPVEKLVTRGNFLPDPPVFQSGDGDYAVFVGRMTAEKGVLTLLKAWQQVEGFELRIVGDGEIAGECKQYARANNINVKFLGYLPREETLTIIQHARFMILPSECYEGFPISLLEAYACGTPILVSNIGGQSQIVRDGATGKKFEVGNPDDLADKCKALIANNDLVNRLKKNARDEFDQQYTQEAVLKETLGIYESLVA